MNPQISRRRWMAVVLACGRAPTMGAGAAEGSVAPFQPGDLMEYEQLPGRIQLLIRVASDLTFQKLGYTFGSNDPARGGMDCSGTIHHTLTRAGIRPVPRSSFDQYVWAREAKTLREVAGHPGELSDPAFRDLRPGDLVFWEGTYEAAGRKPAISHVMLYLGTLAGDRKPVLFGASDGRQFRGRKIHGVSAFDFALPKTGARSRLVGYAAVPGLR